jgi:protein TonB
MLVENEARFLKGSQCAPRTAYRDLNFRHPKLVEGSASGNTHVHLPAIGRAWRICLTFFEPSVAFLAALSILTDMPELLVNADPPRVGFRRQRATIAFRAEESPTPAWRPRQARLPRSLPPVDRLAPSRPPKNRFSHSVGWLASLLFHATLLVLGASLLVRSAHLEVIPGKTSIEMILMAPSPAVVLHPPAPIHATTPPPPAPLAQPVLPSVAIPKIQAPPAPVSAIASIPVPAKHHSPVPVSRAGNAFPTRGAVEARPDELNNQPPVYPEESRTAHEEGVVMLRADVSSTGEVHHVAVLKSSGYFRLDQAAREAVRAWRFHPALFGDVAISSQVDVPVRFELR